MEFFELFEKEIDNRSLNTLWNVLSAPYGGCACIGQHQEPYKIKGIQKGKRTPLPSILILHSASFIFRKYQYVRHRRTGARVVESTGLENRQACKRLVGSNPTLSARISRWVNFPGLTNILTNNLNYMFIISVLGIFHRS